jgi:hypothetical protein
MIRSKDRIRKRFRDKAKLTLRERLKLFWSAIGLTIIGFFVAYQFVDPAPPRAISIACGPQEGANFIFAKAYREFMAKDGVTLNIKTTSGAAENLKLLQAASDGVEVAFVQGGLKSLVQNGHLMSQAASFSSHCGFSPHQSGHRASFGSEGGCGWQWEKTGVERRS